MLKKLNVTPSVLLAGLLASTAPVFAQTSQVADNSAATGNAGGAGVEAVEVFGVRRETSLNLNAASTAGSRLNLSPLQTPASVNVLSGDLIRDLGIVSLSQAKTEAPGITSFSYPGNGGNSFANRGFYGDNSVKQLYDGIEIYNAGSTLSFPFDSWNVDRIETLSGPASVLYGAGAIGGAINVVPKRPNPTARSNSFQVAAGSFNSFREAADSTGPIGDTDLSYRLDVSHFGSDGYVNNSASDSIALSGSVRYDAAPNLSFVLSDDYGDQNQSPYAGTPTVNNRPVEKLKDTSYNVSDEILNFVDNWITLATEWAPASNVSVHNDAYYLTHRRRYHDVYGFTYVPASDTVKLSNFRDIQAHEWQLGDNGYVKVDHTLLGLSNSVVVGFDVNDNSYYRQDNASLTTGSYGGAATVPALGAANIPYSQGSSQLFFPKYKTNVHQIGEFGEDRLSVTDQLSLVLGIRNDHYDVDRYDLGTLVTTKSSYNSTGYNVGVVYNPISDLSLYAQYARAVDPVSSFSSISAAQQAFTLSPGKQVEIGTKASLWDGLLEGTFAAYSIIKNNLLAPDPSNPSVSIQVGSQSSRGLEASFVLRPTDDFTIQANGTILKAKYDNFTTTVGGKAVSLAGYQPVSVPNQSGNILAFWQFLPNWQFRSSVQYVGQRFIDATNTTPLPSYYNVGAGLRWAATSSLKVDLRLDNVFDKTYAAASPLTSQWILGAPRNVTVTLDYAL